MASNQHCLYFAIFFLCIALTYSDSQFLSHEALKADNSTGRSLRSLLQGEENCPINLKGQDYTIITSKCKGPKYPAKRCCQALLQFSCGFADILNDVTNNDCAHTMFCYINLHGNYPVGLFAKKCKGDEKGLPCKNALQA